MGRCVGKMGDGCLASPKLRELCAIQGTIEAKD